MINKKVVMLGQWGVGKTSLVRQFVHSAFDETYLSTLGVKVDKKQIALEQQEITLMLWDIAGAENHLSIPMHYVKGAAAFLLVIDGTRAESLETAMLILQEVVKKLGKLPFVVAINKTDLDWAITESDITDALPESDVVWFSTSAKTGENVEAVFTALAKKLL